VILLLIDSVFSFEHEHEKERMIDKPCHRRNVAYNFQSACEKAQARCRGGRSRGEAEVFRASAMAGEKMR